jgi:hypothetical protein
VDREVRSAAGKAPGLPLTPWHGVVTLREGRRRRPAAIPAFSHIGRRPGGCVSNGSVRQPAAPRVEDRAAG